MKRQLQKRPYEWLEHVEACSCCRFTAFRTQVSSSIPKYAAITPPGPTIEYPLLSSLNNWMISEEVKTLPKPSRDGLPVNMYQGKLHISKLACFLQSHLNTQLKIGDLSPKGSCQSFSLPISL